ncbi:MAG: tetratricopeptide repeat protein [Cyanobacteria bacterium SZAS LIN-2]|nr:tetratricopeptide repeat protein [Cyanobacteria bacterium SZAS LIN-2]MBS2010948.1 tetratricopeptide repeat protein [Cyanobacteria bacterium SZAS TMP-1]
MSETPKATEGEKAPVDAEKLLTQARMALKTGKSAYENENFAFAETLLVKALDLFEQAGKVEDVDYFQCLHQIADTYFQLGRYYEAKSYYERLSVARLKNPESTDAQVVVALLKLASTYEKLNEVAEALTAYDLIMELAEKTIPNGHALFGVIFDSYEELIARQLTDPGERESREGLIMAKREQFGFPRATTEARWAHAVTPEEEGSAAGESDNVLTQGPDQIRRNLKAWTHTDMIKPEAALGEAVQRANQERLAELQAREESPAARREEPVDRQVQAHLHPDMFRRKPQATADDEHVEVVEKELGAPDSPPDTADAEAAGAVKKRGRGEPGTGKSAKRINTDRKRFNPIPALSVLLCLGAVGGAVFVAHEYAKNSGAAQGVGKPLGAIDYTGQSWVSSDTHKMLRCTSPAGCEYTVAGTVVPGLYDIKGQPGSEKSILSDFFNGQSTKLVFDQTPAGLKSADGTILYADNSKDKQILIKAQAIANFATYYYASHGHFYPGRAEDFQFGNARFAWENPITGAVNKPIVKKELHNKGDFDSNFLSNLKNMRESKAVFDADSATGSPAGLIECLALIPVLPGAASVDAPPPEGMVAPEDAGCAFLIRCYDSEGKMITSSNPAKAYVIVLKNGISIDPAKALHEEPDAPPATPKVQVMINPMATAADDKK